MERPIDQTSAQMVYSLPVMRSGWKGRGGGGEKAARNVIMMSVQIARENFVAIYRAPPCIWSFP